MTASGLRTHPLADEVERMDGILKIMVGATPMDVADGPFPVGWDRLLKSITRFALWLYVPVRAKVTAEDWEEVVQASETLGQVSIDELRALVSTGRVPLGPRRQPFGVHTLWVLDRTFNARVVRLSGDYVVLLHLATPILLYRFYREFVKLPDYFPEVDGDVAAELAQPVRFDTFDPRLLPEHLTLQHAMLWGQGADEGPVAATRLVLAELLTFLSLQVLVAHEVAHIVAGHCDYLFERNLGALAEVGADDPTGVLQLMETEADILLCGMLLQLTEEDYERMLGRYLRMVGLPVTREVILALLVHCTRLLSTILGNLEVPGAGETHPHWTSRKFVLHQAFMDHAELEGISGERFNREVWQRFGPSCTAALNAVPYRSWIRGLVGEAHDDFVLGALLHTQAAWDHASELTTRLATERTRWQDYSLVQ